MTSRIFGLATIVACLAIASVDAAVVATLDHLTHTEDMVDENEFFFFNGWSIDTTSVAGDGNQFATMTLDPTSPAYNAGNNGAGIAWHLDVANYNTELGHDITNGNVVRMSMWVADDASDPLLNEGLWTDSIKFEMSAEPFSNGNAELMDTGSDPLPPITIDFMNSNCDLVAGTCGDPGIFTAPGWHQVTMQYEIDDLDFTGTGDFAGQGIEEVVEIRPVLFLGDFTGGEDEQGTILLDRLIVEVFEDLATANATPLDTTNPGGFDVSDPVSCDFDGSTVCDGTDADLLVAEIVAMTNGSAFDLNSDSVVNAADMTAWLAAAGAENLASGNSYLPGDANLDGNVDGGDFLAWNDNKFTSLASWTGGDFTTDGNIDGGDFLVWNDNKFTSADTAAVPEPAGLMMVVCCGLLSLFGRRGRA